MSAPLPGIYAAGLTCPAGETFPDVVAAYASGDHFQHKERSLTGADGLPPVIASVYPLGEPADVVERLRKLLGSAHADCLGRLATVQTVKHFPMVLVLPGWMGGQPAAQSLLEGLKGDRLARVGQIGIAYGGHAKSLKALHRASVEVAEARAPGYFVAAVDSHLTSHRLDRLAAEGLLLSKDNPYGFVPGEAGVVLFVGSPETAASLPELGRLTSTGEAREPEDNSSGAPRGRGLADSYRRALEGLPDGKAPDRLIVDLNGQRQRSEAFGYAVAAVAPRLGDLGADPEAPSVYLGDLGAASGLVMAALALGPKPIRRRRGLAPADEPQPPPAVLFHSTFISASSASGLRFAAVIETPTTMNPERETS